LARSTARTISPRPIAPKASIPFTKRLLSLLLRTRIRAINPTRIPAAATKRLTPPNATNQKRALDEITDAMSDAGSSGDPGDDDLDWQLFDEGWLYSLRPAATKETNPQIAPHQIAKRKNTVARSPSRVCGQPWVRLAPTTLSPQRTANTAADRMPVAASPLEVPDVGSWLLRGRPTPALYASLSTPELPAVSY